MDLIPDEDQQQVSDLAANFVTNELPLTRFAEGEDMAAMLRPCLAEMGWLAMSLSEESGGAGFSVLEEVLVLRQLGRLVGPTFPIPALLAAKFADAQGIPDVRDAIATGQSGVALSFAASEGAIANHLAGSPATLYDIDGAQFVLVIDQHRAALLDLRALTPERAAWLDPGISVAHIDLTALPVIAEGAGERLFLNGALLTAAMLVGLAEGAIAMIQDYAGVRETFGRKIGAYQAVRHPIAEGAARCEHAGSLLHFAALSLAGDRSDKELQVRSAKVIAQRAASRNADLNIQLHGGIGITWELPAHRFMKRALMLSHWFGDRKAHLDALLHAPLLTI